MKNCSCGELVDENYTQCPRCEALKHLGLNKYAAEDDIRSAYRMFAKLWHPDNFELDEKLKAEAANKLKNVETAFEFLTWTSTERALQPRPIYLSADAASPAGAVSQAASPVTEPALKPAVASEPATPAAPPQKLTLPLLWQKTADLFEQFKFFLVLVVVLLVILRGSFIYMSPPPVRRQAATAGGASQPNAPKQTQAAPAGPAAPQTPAASQTPTAPQSANSKQADKTQAAPHSSLPFITVGSTKDEVLAQEGTAATSSEDKLVYGKSELYFKDGRVTGWRIDPGRPLHVKLWPGSYVNPRLARYSIGSTKDEVLTVQGTPTAFTDNKFEYGKSEVTFVNDRVVGWKEDPSSTPLWIH
ncbi:MAG: DnaJ domain-containing protein [Terracidiphilus sp.]